MLFALFGVLPSFPYIAAPSCTPQVTLELLLEMNDDVKGACVIRDPMELLASDPGFFSGFSLVIATQLSEDEAVRLDSVLRARGVPLLLARSYGLLGSVRLEKAEHRVVESRLDSEVVDLRIRNPFPALRAYVDSLNMSSSSPSTSSGHGAAADADADAASAGGGAGAGAAASSSAAASSCGAPLDDMTFRHVPYVAILMKVLDKWKAEHGGELPKGFGEKAQFADSIRALARSRGAKAGDEGDNFHEALQHAHEAYAFAGVTSEMRAILDDPAAAPANLKADTPHFWFVVAALRDFVAAEGALPVAGTLPDMTATTDLYVSLQRVYQAQAAADAAAVSKRVAQLLAAAGLPPTAIPADEIALMCKNARHLRVFRYRSLAQECGAGAGTAASEAIREVLSDAVAEVEGSGVDEEGEETVARKKAQQTPLCWYLALRAADRFRATHGRYPGTPADADAAAVEADAAGVWTHLQAVLAELGVADVVTDAVLSAKHAAEVTRYGAGEPHVTAAVVAGVAAQEAVKLLTHQYVPLVNTWMWSGVASTAGVYEL